MRKTTFSILFAVAITAALAATETFSAGVPNPNSASAAALYARNCASCHGRSGGGDGPVAGSLKVPPPDLRLLARHNRGEFPRARVQAFLTHGSGASSPAHGTSDMPVWGPVFKGLGDTETRSKVRVANLVQYLESIQEK